MKNFLSKIENFFLAWWENSVMSFAIACLALASLFVWFLISTFSQTIANSIIITLFAAMMIGIIIYLVKHRGNK